MSADREKLNQLLAKVEELTVILNKVSEELRVVSASLKSLAVGQITAPKPAASAPLPPSYASPPTPKPAFPPATAPPSDPSKQRSLDDIRMSFPEELESRLGFEEKGDYILIKPKQF